jgi:hypothetical protein
MPTARYAERETPPEEAQNLRKNFELIHSGYKPLALDMGYYF